MKKTHIGLIFGAILLYLPFHALLSTWFGSLVGYELFWKSFKDIVLALALVAVCVRWRTIYLSFAKTLLGKITFGYVALQLLYALFSDASAKALLAGIDMNLRFIAAFLLTYGLVRARIFSQEKFSRVLIMPFYVVIIFGLLQLFVLPKDFLVHFGYAPTTIPPYFLIDNNPNLVRIISTLRGPNPLGVYMSMAVSIFAAIIVSSKTRRLKHILVFSAALLVLYGSGSRGSWFGALAALGVVMAITTPHSVLKKCTPIFAGIFIVACGLLFIGKNTPLVQQYLFHADPKEASAFNSDDARIQGLKNGIEEIAASPFGRGVGSSGPASQFGLHPRIVENYYLQTAQEVGVFGALLFVTWCGVLMFVLLKARAGWLKTATIAAFVAGLIANLFWPAWTDETISVILFAMIGFVIGDQASEWKGGESGKQKRHKANSSASA